MTSVRALLRILLCMALALQGAVVTGRADASPAPRGAAMAHHGCHDMAMGMDSSLHEAGTPMKHPPQGQGGDSQDAACRAFCAWHCAAPLLPAVALHLLAMPTPAPAIAVVGGRPPPHLPDPIRPPIV